MTTQAYQIANIFGLDVNNKQHSIAIIDALNGIDNLDEFVAYCRDGREKIKFASKTEKLDALAYAYKKEQLEKKLPHDKARSYARNLSEKVKNCVQTIEDYHCRFRDIVNADTKARVFERHELVALSKIGTTGTVVMLSRDGDLEDKIYEAFIQAKREEFVKTKRLGAGTDKSVSALIGKTVKGMK